MQDILKDLLDAKTLDRARARRAMDFLMDGKATPVQTAAFLAALRVRGETLDEVVGFAQSLRERSLKVVVQREPLIDTCGTGGDGSGTFNISTAAAFVAAGAGVAVAKHGNRSVSSRCGSADVLEALGVKTTTTPELMARCVEEAGVGFLFAQALHPAVKHAAPVRKELGVRTVFNLLGPLVNPAQTPRQLMGVYSVRLVALAAQALKELGSVEVLVVSSYDGLDEISLSGKTKVARLKAGRIEEFDIEPKDFGLPVYPPGAFAGGGAEDNARILLSILKGERGPARDIVLVNSAAALVAAGKASGIKEGLAPAAESIDSGKALKSLEKLKEISHA